MFMTKFREVLAVISLRSKVFSEYFNNLMRCHNVKSFHNGIKVLIFYYFFEVIMSHMAERTVMFRPIVATVFFCIFFAIFLISASILQNSVMTKVSSIMVVLCMIYSVIIASDIHEITETHYSLTVVVIVMMYNLFKLKLLISGLLSLIYIIIFLTIVNYRLTYMGKSNDSIELESELRNLRLIGVTIDNKYNYIIGQGILLILIMITALYLRFFNSIRRKSAFLKLAQNAEAKIKSNSAIQVQIYWIEAIMPHKVKDEFLKQISNKDMYNLVYCQKFDNVSILFADIVGFTEMSSNKSAEQLVFLLNDLYNRFDEHGKFTNCEKIGTLGDCYYCVSGCPIARPDHAVCCVEMGLGMCRMIQKFNKDHMENVNMRVGVHSGKVIAAIIGNHRFRFDVFSNDVIIANALETSGAPGLVHISDQTYVLVRHAYVFKDGEYLEVKKEKSYGLSGMLQMNTLLKTYFVVPNAVLKKKVHDLSFNNSKKNNSNLKKATNIFDEVAKATKEFQDKDKKIKKDLNLISTLQTDPTRPVQFFQNPPINSFFLTFLDKEIEAHYLFHSIDQIKGIHVDSIKVAPLIDAITCMIYSTALIWVAYIMMPRELLTSIYLLAMYISGLIVTLIMAWTSLVYKSEIEYNTLRNLFYFFHHPIIRLMLMIYISCLPIMLVFAFNTAEQKIYSYQYISSYFTLTIFGLMGNCIFAASYSSIKYMSTIAFTLFSIKILIGLHEYKIPTDKMIERCSKYLIRYLNIQKDRNDINYCFQLVNICILIYYLTRENEKNIRIHFYASREAEIRSDEAKREKRIAESLLYNIIPKYVFSQIMSNKQNVHKHLRFSYAHAIPNAGVLFACISNFFSSYYREDYKGGEVALKLLHTIMCTFDNLLQKPIYEQVEKIKTINDCYMVASGLNTDLETDHTERHLRTLLNFAFEMQSNLYNFNRQYIVGNDSFKLKVGYNFGPVTAGIIGNTRPLYDIWGDTVNVASRMYSTAPSGFIQVPDYVESKLNRFFEFQLRGNVNIKGKGDMLTYLATKVYDSKFLKCSKKISNALF